MKAIVLSILLLITLNSFAGKGENRIDSLPHNHPLITQLKAINLQHYQELPVDSLLSALPAGIVSLNIRPSILLKRAHYLVASYGNDVTVFIFVARFRFMNPEFAPTGDPDQNWDINQFKKESLTYAVIFNFSCINGCENERRIN